MSLRNPQLTRAVALHGVLEKLSERRVVPRAPLALPLRRRPVVLLRRPPQRLSPLEIDLWGQTNLIFLKVF